MKIPHQEFLELPRRVKFGSLCKSAEFRAFMSMRQQEGYLKLH
jgi:hypothetical protein